MANSGDPLVNDTLLISDSPSDLPWGLWTLQLGALARRTELQREEGARRRGCRTWAPPCTGTSPGTLWRGLGELGREKKQQRRVVGKLRQEVVRRLSQSPREGLCRSRFWLCRLAEERSQLADDIHRRPPSCQTRTMFILVPSSSPPC